MYPRDYALDVLKAFAIIIILQLHLQLLRFMPSSPFTVIVLISNLIGWLGVPILLLVSLYLYFSRAPSLSYLRTRLWRIGLIYFFWTLIQVAVFLTVCFTAPSLIITKIDCAIPSIFDLLIWGGPSLPVVGGSVFYFLSYLFLLTLVGFLYAHMNSKIRTALGVAIVLVCGIYLEICTLSGVIPNPIGIFLPYVPLAYFLRNNDSLYRFRFALIFFFMLFTLHDLQNAMNISAYGRVSVILGSVGVFCLVKSLKSLTIDRHIVFISRYSLGIFAMHKYFQLLSMLFFTKLFLFFGVRYLVLFDFQWLPIYLPVGLVTILLSVIVIKLLGKVGLRKFVYS